jgi:hypothetical protein
MRLVLFLLLLLTSVSFAAELGPEARMLGADPDYYAAKALHGLDIAAANAKTIEVLHYIQLAVERYSIDNNDMYPESIDTLVQQGYLLPGLYINPVASSDGLALNAKDVPFGWSEIAPGNFTYLKKYNSDGDVVAYLLVAYGADTTHPGSGGVNDVNLDGKPDGVILMLWTAMTKEDGTAAFINGPNELLAHGEKVSVDFKRLFPGGAAK